MLANAGTVSNLGTAAQIAGGQYGVFTGGTNATVLIINQGSIVGTSVRGVYLTHGGTVTNSGTAALITGQIGVGASNAAAARARSAAVPAPQSAL